MDAHWTLDNVEEQSRNSLGAELACVADLFPRVVNAIYVQMTNGDLQDAQVFTTQEFKRRVLAELPKNCEEVLPFFVRTAWNKRWHPSTHASDIQNLAAAYAEVVEKAGGHVTVQELITACEQSFS